MRLISAGLGSCGVFASFASSHSSAMISLQRSTHSLQMKTDGPAMSFFTSSWPLPQNEHLSGVVWSFFSVMLLFLLRGPRKLLGDHLVHEPVGFGVVAGHEEVPVRVGLDLFDGLARGVREDLVQRCLHI